MRPLHDSMADYTRLSGFSQIEVDCRRETGLRGQAYGAPKRIRVLVRRGCRADSPRSVYRSASAVVAGVSSPNRDDPDPCRIG